VKGVFLLMSEKEQIEKDIDHLVDALLVLDQTKVKDILTQFTNKHTIVQHIEETLIPALEKIGIGWDDGDVSLSQVYMSGRICEEIVDSILPPCAPDRKDQPKMAIVILEDYHALGARIVYSLLRSSGYELINLGRVTVDKLVQIALDEKIEILLISTLMLPSALRVKELRKKFEVCGYPIKIVVGGAPFRFDAQLWKEVGADAYGATASDALMIIRSWLR
jgi:methanogenic corrinoid protein MtbC1